MKYIGAHVSAGDGVSNTPLNAHLIGAKSFALFTRNPSRWTSKPIPQAQAEAFRENCMRYGYSPAHILPHDSFLINLGSPDAVKLEKSREAFLDELRRCEQLGLTMLNFHPGSHMREMETDACLDLIADSLNGLLEKTAGVKAVIENTAGQGSNLGYSFDQIARIIDRVDDKTRIGVCIDTCHAYTAGYDLATAEGYDKTWAEFDSIIGFSYLCGMHLNDTQKGLGSHVDRHAPIATANLDREFWSRLMNDPRFDDIPLILETPDEAIWAEEISLLYSLDSRKSD
ncbi:MULTISPECIES: deoxyribonuclease IV [Duncaniella]|jgi:deoxyribonuclease-4|uniref:Probable endonuclease 4 n=5 Tax=Duncaniella muris TaxID=2094150 RepID=A0A2V1ITY8_9BACT|nr:MULTISPECIES: deoxyribonuclease IV [Duncaniella]NBH92113.1 deoxyribonuclease IV [Muribaculaceae bacterium S4]NBI20606.1 deoxyribonuclease IV [Muribaculaceae bacterium Z1]ROS91713.1 deoxyribonuclease IV [Muribaculaceae bacterium Isolate-039 (Harlan)]ROS96403.1 deoxyribonuclease IV [Muribaculaceae bacterium Isolate-077 (Janvier)]ROS97601.1 deoxyribonuclease IV [Muribaculaceae bacterium Isolate-083 (Janvier)]ROT00060.1 deoxyribonuclease IV [Muribaculaceae bacterium Isolate-084 (Janvier)]GFI5